MRPEARDIGAAVSESRSDEQIAFVKPGSATMNGGSLWSRLAGLALIVEGCEYDRLHAVLAHEFQRVTTHVRLVGAGAYGLGEDVSVHVEDGTSLHETQPTLPLAGAWTPRRFRARLAPRDTGGTP